MSPPARRLRWKRASILLRSHDYGGGAWYFITICAAGRKRFFGTLTSAGVLRSPLGELVMQRWAELPLHLPFAHFDSVVVMPDHLHGLIRVWPLSSRPLHADGARRFGPLPRRALGLIINLLKGGVTRRARELRLIAPTTRLWHRGYHDRIIRDARHLANARAYIRNNPIRAIESAGRRGRMGSMGSMGSDGSGWDGRP